MSKGKIYHDQQLTYTDRYSKREVRQLTNYLGHSYQLYFTHPCWADDDSAVIFKSEREDRSNYFRYDLTTGEVLQLTDLEDREIFQGCFSPANHCLYYWVGQKLYELKLDRLTERLVSEAAPPMRPGANSEINVTADGRYVVSLLRDLEPGLDLRGVNLFELRARSQIVRIEVASGAIEVLHEDRRHINHLNSSPTRPDLMTFCHEGPWEKVEQRMWGLKLDTQEVWPIRPQHGEYSGHRRTLVRRWRAHRLPQSFARRQRHPLRLDPL